MLANLTIARKLLIAFAALIVAFVATACFIVVSMADVDRATGFVRSSKAAAVHARALAHAFVAEQNAVRGFVISQSDKLLADIAAERKSFSGSLEQFRSIEKDPQILERVAIVESLTREWRERSADKQVALARDPVTRPSVATFVSGQYATKILAGLNEIVGMENAITAKHSAAQDQASSVVRLALVIAGTVMVAGAGALWWLLTRSIAKPVSAMTEAMRRLAGGDTATSIPAEGRGDEIGQMAAALRVFRDAAIDKDRVEQAAADARRQAEAQRAAAERDRETAAAAQGEVVAKLGEGLARLARGDLTARLNQAFAPEYEQVRADFNAAQAELHSAMQLVLANAAGLRSGTQEITQAADDLARRTEQQAASLEQTAAALGEITGAVRKAAEGAEQARGTVAAARLDAERSGHVVEDAVSAMSEIERSAQQISQIIGVIDEIAFQTNLLALNAGVEAARAGDAGRGFAVVASEVRALAQRSADAAKEIKSLILASTGHVGRGVGLVDETGKSLSRIMSQVADISTIVNAIAVSAKEQATGLAEVSTAINQMDQVTQQNAAMVEESTAASHGLAHEAEELARLTSRFRIDRAPEQRRELATVERRRAGHGPGPGASAIVHATRGAAALAAKPAAQQDEWEEF